MCVSLESFPFTFCPTDTTKSKSKVLQSKDIVPLGSCHQNKYPKLKILKPSIAVLVRNYNFGFAFTFCPSANYHQNEENNNRAGDKNLQEVPNLPYYIPL